ncbi:MAG: DUF2779 domain-containing protein [Rhizomicrobium sp.]
MVRPITKSDYLAGLQCPLRLWSRHHAPIPYEERVETSAMRTGTDIGLLAHRLFSGGVLVEARPWARAEAVAETNGLLADRNVPAIFEGGFLYDGLHVRVDILKRKPSGAFALYEVKGTGSVKEQHIPDLAFQVHVARRSGLEIDEAGIIHIDTNYVLGDELDVTGLFTISNETANVEKYLGSIDGSIADQKATLAGDAPVLEPGGHCHSPYQCEFWERCTAEKPDDWIFYLPRLRADRYEVLCQRGIESIREIPDEFPLSELQVRIREVLRTRRPYIGPDLSEVLAEVSQPLAYLDFETVNPGVPLWQGTRPFQRIPFQWSLHRTTGPETVTHAEFLADGNADPRRAFAESLAEQLGTSEERIIVYNAAFEGSVLRDMANLYTDLAPKLLSIKERLWDLLPVVRNNVYYLEFEGSFSIKAVAPALTPEVSYAALDGIAEGSAASDAFVRIAKSEFFEGETENDLHSSLLSYCRVDTFAIMKVLGVLIDLRRV